MKRRSFIQSLGLMGSSVLVPSMFGGQSVISNAVGASVSQRAMINARAMLTDQVNLVLPTVLPQVINIFLYGGPSELGGNLTNIDEINGESKNKYPANLLPGGSEHTLNGFWKAAGGEVMERMVANKRLSVYRTINRVDDNSRAHRPSIFSNLTGMLGEDDLRPGIGTNIASFLSANNAITEDSRFPFVTFDGESLVYNQGSSLPLAYKPLSLNQNLENPYQRFGNTVLGDAESALDELAKSVMKSNAARYAKVSSAFTKRDEIDTFIGSLTDTVNNDVLTLRNPDFVLDSTVLNEVDEFITYPNNGLGARLKAAVGLVVSNPETLFVSLGTDGLGGWDDHNAVLENNRYSNRMQNLMRSLEVASQHLEAAGRGNVVINVYGDFGRNANLNDSLGWDHGNCQNLYTVGAASGTADSLAGRELGKIVGETTVKGNANQNRLFTHPTDNSYQCEPFAIAASVYKYFGVQNPEILTGGYAAIDETAENLLKI
ncbi:MAG: DUF1501 domain-containing protein [Gammaproteobacteria bacterium]|nr:DUF1501 domain-containing protein [Gammaproteobacteria bacterium]